MKKIYVNPETTVLNIQTTHMIAASDPDYDPNRHTSATSGNLSRRSNFWNYDDEEEY